MGLIALRICDLQCHCELLAHDIRHTSVALGQLGRLLISHCHRDLVERLNGLSVVGGLFVVKIHRVAAADHKHARCNDQNDQDRSDPE